MWLIGGHKSVGISRCKFGFDVCFFLEAVCFPGAGWGLVVSVRLQCSLSDFQVDFDQLQDNLCQMERRCKASWDHLKAIAKHEMKPVLKQRMSEFLKDCAERIIILKIVHRRIINR